MERKIYFNSNFVILTDVKYTNLLNHCIECTTKSDVLHAISIMQEGEGQNLYLYNQSFIDICNIVESCFVYIEAAGGVVQNEYSETLFIYRNDMWDLPKGKLDAGESPEQAAIREVQEETGIAMLDLKQYLCSTWHTYEHKKGTVLKQTYWYRMCSTQKQELIPQIEEGIREVTWVARNKFPTILSKTYPSIIDVIHAAK